MSKRITFFTSIKIILPFIALMLSVVGVTYQFNGTGAFVTSAVQAASNLIGPGLFPTPCTEGEKWLDEVITGQTTQGPLKNNSPVTDPLRTDPTKLLGSTDSAFYSLGKAGVVVARFENSIEDGSGDDLVINEVTFGDRNTYAEETALVEVSQDGTTWFALPEAVTSKATGGVNGLDISSTGLSSVLYIRLTDTTNFGPHDANADGIDIESVQAIYGLCEVLPVESGSISGAKYQDNNTNGQKDNGESGLQGWSIYAGVKVWESDVQAQDTPAVNSPNLDNGVAYIARVTGTYDAGDGINADALYSYRTPTSSSWTDAVNSYEGYGPTLLDLQIDGSSVSWGDYNTNHVYWLPLTGAGTTKSFEIYDLNNGSNNAGNLHVELFRVIAQDITDATGNYDLDWSGYPTDTIYLFEGMQSGWTQTEPGAANYYHSVAADQRENTFNFGNQQSNVSAPQISDVTVCKVDQAQQALNGWKMVLHQPSVLETVRVYPSDANGAFGGSVNQIVASSNLSLDDYVLMANGMYTYRSEMNATSSDATFSQRATYDPVYGGAYAPWVNVTTFPNPNTGWLGVMVNGSSTNWANAYNPDHIYALGYENYSGQFNFTILDDIYSDNNGYIDVAVYKGWAQETASNGCTTFQDVPYGSYTLEEIGQSGWQYQSGDQGTVVVDGATETFTLVNAAVNTNTAPVSSMTVTSSPTKQIENRISNGGFESGLDNWTHVGDVEVINSSDVSADPAVFGQKLVRIGRPTSPGNSVDVNILSQDVSNAGNGLRSVGFWYNFKTFESGDGFDEPGFMVFVGDQMVHQVWASDVLTDSNSATLDESGWQFISIDLTDLSDSTLSLAFYGGNSGDLSYQSYVEVDNVTTNEAAVNAAAEFTLQATDNTAVSAVHYRYTVGGSETHVSTAGDTVNFSITAQPDNGIIEYWAVDSASMEENHKSFHVMYDNAAPAAIANLDVTDDSNGDFTLTWVAPTDANPYNLDKAAEYDIRYATNQGDLTAANWDSLPQATIKNIDGLPGGGTRAPLMSGSTEVYSVHVNGSSSEYWFAVRSRDRARNLSDLSEVSSSGTTSTPVSVQAGDVIINEVMWMGSTTGPADEWIELRNMTSADINLTNWTVEGLGTGGALTITSGTLPANGYFVIANSAAASSALLNEPHFVTSTVELANTGEQLILKDSSAALIDQTPAGVWAAGSNTAQKRSMERNNTPGDGSDVANWHSCDSQSCTEARSLYWDSVGENYGTPNAANLSFTEAEIVPEAHLTQPNPEHVLLSLSGVQIYTTAEYTIEYQHEVDGQQVSDAITDKLEFPLTSRDIKTAELFLGTCSSDEQSCVPHQKVTLLKATITLKAEGVSDKTLAVELE
ncbi:MAG TPA: lamin tail domain-containing protein [Vitreimonas sp.]|nr:lamin tail domain-containing protein [Vitreimonas sp.]